MPELARLGPSNRRPGQPSAEQLAAIKADGRVRRGRIALVVGSALTTTAVVGIATAVATGGPDRARESPLSPTTSPSSSAPDGRAALQRALNACLEKRGITIDGTGGLFYPNQTDPSAPSLDDLNYACTRELQQQGYRIIARSPDPGPDLTQVLEIHFTSGTYDEAVQARVDQCYQRPGVTPLPSAAPSPPSQRFRFDGNNIDEGRIIFGCLDVIPGVNVIDIAPK